MDGAGLHRTVIRRLYVISLHATDYALLGTAAKQLYRARLPDTLARLGRGAARLPLTKVSGTDARAGECWRVPTDAASLPRSRLLGRPPRRADHLSTYIAAAIGTCGTRPDAARSALRGVRASSRVSTLPLKCRCGDWNPWHSTGRKRAPPCREGGPARASFAGPAVCLFGGPARGDTSPHV